MAAASGSTPISSIYGTVGGGEGVTATVTGALTVESATDIVGVFF